MMTTYARNEAEFSKTRNELRYAPSPSPLGLGVFFEPGDRAIETEWEPIDRWFE